jgi:hypothetical protein
MCERHTDKVNELVEWRNRVEGQGLGSRESRAGLFAALAGVAAALGIVVVALNLLTGR